MGLRAGKSGGGAIHLSSARGYPHLVIHLLIGLDVLTHGFILLILPLLLLGPLVNHLDLFDLGWLLLSLLGLDWLGFIGADSGCTEL